MAPAYAEQVRKAGTPALLVNYVSDPAVVDDGCFGGAFLVSADGRVVARHPLGVEGVMLVDL